ncbi:MAG: cytochrome c biogenesis protein CcsA, partial [Candidatus Binatia bacterium]
MLRQVENLILTWIPLLVGPAAIASLIMIFFVVPTDAALGVSQRIFYYHVSAAITSLLAFAGAGVASAAFLKTNAEQWDHAAHAAVTAGLMFATMALVTGSLWARTAWGTWWTWDARLTTFLILWAVFAGYELLRTLSRGNEMGRRYAAVLAIVGALNIPLVQFATRLWRTIHPQVIRNPEGGISDPAMQAAFLLSLATFWLLLAWM